MDFKVCEVSKPFLSVKRLIEKGNLVCFGPGSTDNYILTRATNEKIVLKPAQTEMIPMGFAMHLEDTSLAALVIPRSGLGSKHGIVLGNLVGLIDSDYQGELMVPAWNRSNIDFEINPGDRIAQMVVAKHEVISWNTKLSLDKSKRGESGFGSTGI